MIKKNKIEKSFALSQIFLLMISIIAISYAFGSEVGIVSGQTTPSCYLKNGKWASISPCIMPNGIAQISGGAIPKEPTSPLPVNPPTTPNPTKLSSVASFDSKKKGLSNFDNILGGKSISSGTTSIKKFANYDAKFTSEMKTAFENAGASNIELNSDGTLKSFIEGGKLHSVGAGGVVTSSKVTTTTLFGTTFTGLTANLIQGAMWAAGVYAAIQFLGPMFGLEKETTSALSISASVGIMTASLANGLAESYSGTFKFFGDRFMGLQYGTWTGIGVGVLIFVLMYKKQKQDVVQFNCLPWQAPVGGNNCEDCNKQGLPCSEYQCKSLGQACELLNPGTGKEKCVWVNRGDVNPPTIEPLESALLDNYKYSPDNAISPPDRGVKINYLKANDNCIPAFTPLKFGVLLNEPAKCKIDVLRKKDFKEMSLFMDGGLSNYSHTYALSLPGKSALESENITLKNNGNYEMYVRCEDANGNSNTANFVFKYCVNSGPDTTPPLIVTTSILNNMPIAYNQSSIKLQTYTNEPANCKWSRDDRDYNSMEKEMQCSTSIFEYNAQMLYKCSTTLTGLKDRTENNFYFRCKDQPNSPENKRNTNKESYEFTLIGTQPLVIDSVSPNDTTISDSTNSVKVTLKVKTSAGNKEGESICYYSNNGNENSYIKFFKTQSFEHSQDLYLSEGNYDYFIKCTDLGGNSDYKTINFNVETDLSPPLIVRAYKEENYLKLITDEESQCVYSTFGCSYKFSEGTAIKVVDKTNQFTDWNSQTDLYVKCQDNFGNQPQPDKCSMIVRASDF